MSEDRQKKQASLVGTKRGIAVYKSNPSIPDPADIKKRRPVKMGDAKKGFVIEESGEILGAGAAVLYEFEEVDQERFVKLFLGTVKQAVGLSKAGLAVFELVYNQVQANPGADKIELNAYIAQEGGLTERSYQRGLRELLEREFVFRSPSSGVFFVNIRYMFNGDRLAFVKGYQRKKSAVELSPISESAK